jgi:hypothetical protein
MASCLDNLIGDDNGCATRTGRLYLKDIGIPETFIADILNKEDQSTGTFMADRRRLAAEYVSNDVLTHLAPNVIGRTFVDSDRVGMYADTEELVNGDVNYWHGLVLEVCTPATNTKLLVSKLEFYGETTGPVVVTFKDLRDGSTLATETIDAIAGQVSTLEVDLVFQNARERKRIFVYTDQDVYYKSTLTGGGCVSCRSGHYKNGVLEARQYMLPVGDKAIWNNLVPASDTGGLSIIASVQCDTLGWLCELKGSLALPLLYFMGWQIFDLALNNFQRYGIKDLRKQDVEKRRDEFQAHYGKAMSDLFEGMIIPQDGLCFTCDKRVTSGVLLP